MMQWLIDIVYEAVMSAIGGPPFYVNRGDPAAFDYTTAHFTKDNAWHDLDLSAIIPARARAFHMLCLYGSGQINSGISFRMKGNLNVENAAVAATMIAGILHWGHFTVQLDDNRVIQYRISVDTWIYIGFVVRGWWL